MSGIECKQIKLPEGSPSQRGRSAEVYPWGEDKVLKLYFEGFPEADVDLEYLNTAEAYKCGCTPMKCYEKVRCGIECKQIKLPEGSPSQRGRSAEVYPWG